MMKHSSNPLGLMALTTLLSFSQWGYAQAPILLTDHGPNSVAVELSAASLSLSQDVDNGSSSQVFNNDFQAQGVVITGAASGNGRVTPFARFEVSKITPDEGSGAFSMYEGYLGLALEGERNRHLFYVSALEYSDDSPGSISVGGVFRGVSDPDAKGQYEVYTSLQLQQGTDSASGGHELDFGLRSKALIAPNLYLISRASAELQTQVNYVDGSYRRAKPGLEGAFGLAVLPTPNVSISGELAYYLQSFEYYTSGNRLALSELRTGSQAMIQMAVAF